LRARRPSRRRSSALRVRSWGFPLLARLRNGFDCVHNSLIASTAAVVAGNMFTDRIAGGYAAAGEQLLRGQQHGRRAKAALQRIAAAECVLQIRDRSTVRDALNG